MSAFKLRALHTVPGGYVACVRADGKSRQVAVIPQASFRAHNAEANALEQEANRRQTLQDCEQFVKEFKEQKRREAEQKKAAERQQKLDEARAAKKRKAQRASDKIVNDYLRSMKYAWRPVSVGQASVQAAPASAPPAPVVPKLEEIATLADAERLARIAVQETLPRYNVIMHVDNSAVEFFKPGLKLDRKKLTF